MKANKNCGKIPMALAGLALSLLWAAPSRAQQEVDPDHFDATPAAPAARTQKTPTKVNENTDGRGQFTLSYAVKCQGIVLVPGQYSLAFEKASVGQRVLVRGNGMVIRLRPRAIGLQDAAARSALLVRRDGKVGSLQAIYWDGRVLYIEPRAAERELQSRARTERIPIS